MSKPSRQFTNTMRPVPYIYDKRKRERERAELSTIKLSITGVINK
jgi:hypothetical protein